MLDVSIRIGAAGFGNHRLHRGQRLPDLATASDVIGVAVGVHHIFQGQLQVLAMVTKRRWQWLANWTNNQR